MQNQELHILVVICIEVPVAEVGRFVQVVRDRVEGILRCINNVSIVESVLGLKILKSHGNPMWFRNINKQKT